MSPRSLSDRALRLLTIAAMLACGAFGMATPTSIFVGAVGWLAFLLCVLSGWGYIVGCTIRAPEPELALRAAMGAAAYIAIIGPLIALGIASRPLLLGLIGVGAAGFAWHEVTASVGAWHRMRDAMRVIRARPAMAVLVTVIVGLALVRMLASVAALERSPWDDDLAYTPMIKRLLDAGDLVEPFSLRRLGAYGGQTALQALAAARGTLANIHLLDQGLCFGIAMMLVVGLARERRIGRLWLTMLALVLVLMPNTAINTASYWSGAVFLLALYRTAIRDQWGLAALIGASACTLRQSYIPVVVLFLIVMLATRFAEARTSSEFMWRAERRRWLLAVGVGTLTLLGWWIAAWWSSRTFLFPVFSGTFNRGLSLSPTAQTWLQELRFLLGCCIETRPIVVIPPLFAVLLVASDRRPGRPLDALAAAVILGFVLLVHGFTGSEAGHLWRYAFGPAIALFAVLVIEVGASEDRSAADSTVQVTSIGRWVVLGSLMLQLLTTRATVAPQLAGNFNDLEEAIALEPHGDPSATSARARYQALQQAIPAGARLAVMLDEPAHLDFARNQIVNLDHPGYASPGDQLPAFEGPTAWRDYLVGQGIRYVAFVRSDASRYFFRRGFWVWRLFNDSEIYQVMSAHTIDAIDTFASLASSARVLHDVEGLVALDLGHSPPTTRRRPLEQGLRRGRFVHQLAKQEQLLDAWSLSTREDVKFEDGFSSLAVINDASTDDPTWFQIVHRATPDPQRGTPVRWISRRAHVRLRGSRDMRLVLRGKVNLAAVYTRPRLAVSLDGNRVGEVVVDDQGTFSLDVVVPMAWLGGDWSDLYLAWSTVAEPDKDARDLRVARLFELTWWPSDEAPP